MGSHTGQTFWLSKKGTCLPIFAVQHHGAKTLHQPRASTFSDSDCGLFYDILYPVEKWSSGMLIFCLTT